MIDLYVKNSVAIASDDYMTLRRKVEHDIPQVERSRKDTRVFNVEKDPRLIVFYIRLEKAYNKFTRKVYTVLDWLSDVGGIAQSIISGGLILMYVL